MKKHFFFAYGVVAFLVSGCAINLTTDASDQMYQLAVKLTRLSASVEAAMLSNDLPVTMADDKLLRRATEHNPSLLVPFENYDLKVLREQGHAVLLVCKDGQALLEDAGCTGNFELHRWKSEEPQPCGFALDLSRICL